MPTPVSKTWTIYLAMSPSGKSYIGQTSKGLPRRLRRHSYDAKRGSSSPFHRALRKYGIEEFQFTVLTVLPTKSEADIAEKILIRDFKTQNETVGYNIAGGGQGGGAHRKPHSLETKRKISRTKKGCNGPNKGRKFSEEYCQKIRLCQPSRKEIICDQTTISYPSIAEAARQLGLHKASISQVIRGTRNSIFGLTFSTKGVVS